MRYLFAYIVAVTSLSLGGCAVHYEAIYPRTPEGKIEVKQIPARTALATSGQGDPMKTRNENFRKLFGYIQRNDLAMTVPVETDARSNTMNFYVGSKDAQKQIESEGDVLVAELEPTTVASLGMRGSYTMERYEQGLRTLEAWLRSHPEWAADGEPYAVYWNSPFVPGFMKKSEVHQPVRSAK